MTDPEALPAAEPLVARNVAAWEAGKGRSYPWRSSDNPFHVLSAEIFLQRTRADQVLPVYEDFCMRARGPEDVLESGREQVDSWFGELGLRWRADHYWNLCRELVAKYEGEVPPDRQAIMDLPGVGQYAAGSTMTYAFGVPTGVLDSNILRIYGRYYGIEFKDTDRRRQTVLDWAQAHMPADPSEARVFSLGLLDLGAAVCLPAKPRCSDCPLAERCRFAKTEPHDSPVYSSA